MNSKTFTVGVHLAEVQHLFIVPLLALNPYMITAAQNEWQGSGRSLLTNGWCPSWDWIKTPPDGWALLHGGQQQRLRQVAHFQLAAASCCRAGAQATAGADVLQATQQHSRHVQRVQPRGLVQKRRVCKDTPNPVAAVLLEYESG
jgi:hypothetical protein